MRESFLAKRLATWVTVTYVPENSPVSRGTLSNPSLDELLAAIEVARETAERKLTVRCSDEHKETIMAELSKRPYQYANEV